MTSTPTDPQHIETQVLKPGQYPRSAVWMWPLLWLSLLLGSSAVGLWAVAWMTRIPPLPDCQQISTFSADSERLYCARVGAEAGTAENLIAAMELVSTWDAGHPLYKDSEKLLQNWSTALFEQAQQAVQKGNLNQAVSLAEKIPARSSRHDQAQTAIAKWQAEWQQGETLTAQIEQAIKTRDWAGAKQALQALKQLKSDYWLADRHQDLAQRVKREESARQQLEAAQTLAASGKIADIAQAFAQARSIDLQTQAWSEAKSVIDTWAETLLQYGFQKWEQEDLEAAIAIIQLVPVDLAQAPEAKDLVTFAHAQRLATQNKEDWLPTYGTILNLLEARSALQQISQASPFQAQAKARLDEWTQKLEDTQTLYVASLFAQLGHKPLYQMAIAKANQITTDRPQRLQAQTLISHWHKEIERLEDRPTLARAEQLATGGKIENYQAAIQAATQVELGRALRIEAQTKIAHWSNQIEMIEDRPFLDKALALANEGKLQQAIQAASQVKSDRALYPEAQRSVQEWTVSLQIAQDRPILQRAEALAARGRLSDAIAVASQIGYGRALYREARNAIAIWDRQRDAIWAARGQRRASVQESNQDSDTADD
jgi:hypothetical protein